MISNYIPKQETESSTSSVEDLLANAKVELKADREEQMSFFYTFADSPQFPFQRGYIEIQAEDRTIADKLFRQYFPDIHEGILNCAGIYDKDSFERYQATCKSSESWLKCHGIVSELGFKAGMKNPAHDKEITLS